MISMNAGAECEQESSFFGILFKIHIVIYIYLCSSDKIHIGTAHTQRKKAILSRS